MSSELQHNPSQIVRAVLIAKNLGTFPVPGSNVSWQVFADTEPPMPDNVVTVQGTAGVEAGRSMIDGELQGFFGIQVRVRSALPRPGYLKTSSIQRVMAEKPTLTQEGIYDEVVTLDGVVYLLHCFSRVKDVIYLGKETQTSTRQLHSLNAICTIKTLT